MQYGIYVNQLTAVKFGLNLLDAAIFEIVKNMMASKMEKRSENGKVYTWIAYAKIIEEAPILGITDKDVVGRHVKKLVEQKIIELKVDRKQNSKTYFAAGDNFDEMIFDSSRLKSRQPQEPPSQKSEPAVSKVADLPSQKSDNQYSINQNTNQNNSPTSEEVAQAPTVLKTKQAPSLPAEHKAELDFSWTTLKKYDLLPAAQTERRKTYFAMATHFHRAPVEVLKFANEIAGRWFERASKDQLFPLTANGKIRWAISETEAAISLAGMWIHKREEFFAALKRIINDPKFWKVTFTSLTHFPKAYHSLKDAA